MVQKEEEGQHLRDWYTASAAAEVLSKKSGKKVRPDYLRSLARRQKVQTRKLGPRITLYMKTDVDAYVVEDRGKKAALAAKARAKRSMVGKKS